MKFGVRKPSIKKSISARTTGKLKRSVKRSINPFYGKKGIGFITNPKKALYNKIYNKTTFSLFKSPPTKRTRIKKATKNQSTHSPHPPDMYEKMKALSYKYNPNPEGISVDGAIFPKSLEFLTIEEREKLSYAVLQLRTNRYTVNNVKSQTMRPLMLLIVLFLGLFGIHWFASGRTRRGVAYLLTLGGFCFFWLKDVFTYIISLLSNSEKIPMSKDGTVQYMIPIIETQVNGETKQIIDPNYEQEVIEETLSLAKKIK